MDRARDQRRDARVEVVGGVITGSLAVLADAGHLLSDVGSIGLALLAAALASRPGGARRTFGYQRSEVLAALANGLLLVAVSVAIASPRSAGSAIRRRSTAPASWRSVCSAWRATSRRPSSSRAASARTSTSRACCGTPPPTPSARSAS